MGAIGLDLKFLEGIELNEPTVKAVRFNDDEMYMLKFITYKGMKFSSYVKQLIIMDIRNHCGKKETGAISKGDIKEIMLEVLKDNNYVIKDEVKQIENKDDEGIAALGELGINKRTS